MTYQDFLSETSPAVAQIRAAMARGFSAADAMNEVMGEGAYEMFAKEVYNSIRVKSMWSA